MKKTLFYNGSIVTMDESIHGDALLTEDGRILAVGSEAELRARAGECETVDLGGRALLPGFIDPHSHFFQVAAALLQVSVNGCESPEAIGEKIRAFVVEKHPAEGAWVVARDYDNNLMPGLCNPTLAQLDSYAPGHPLVIHHKSGHMGLMNSQALKTLGITDDTPSPEGGRIEKKDGKCTGYLEENAFFNALRKMGPPSADALLAAFGEAQKKYASYGITTLQDGMVTREMLPMYHLLQQKQSVWLDVMLYADVQNYEACREMADRPGSHIHLGGLKIFLDGSPQGRTAWMRRPYEGDPDYSGYGTMTDEAVEAAFRQAAEQHTQLIAHCNGDAAAEQFLRCLEKAEQDHPELKTLRPVIIHGQLLGRDQLPRVKKLGAMVSFFVAHVYHWGDVHLRNFGRDRADHISPAKSALREGVAFTFHQDAPVIEPDMLETLWCACCRRTRNGVLLGEDERLDVGNALKAITVNAAWQYSLEDEIGSLTPGKRADLTILSGNPLETDPEQLRTLRVEETWKNGQRVYTR